MTQHKVCPREPTAEMLGASPQTMFGGKWTPDVMGLLWRAMYDAAPTPSDAVLMALERLLAAEENGHYCVDVDGVCEMCDAIDAARSAVAQTREKA